EFLNALGTLPVSKDGRKLIIVQLSGGNDGLNTIVPAKNSLYTDLRGKLALPKDQLIRLNDSMAMNSAMQSLKPFYDQGLLGVLNAVGYPNPDRSHFRSMDIWHTASDSNEYAQTGWLGRFLDSACAGCDLPYQAIETDSAISLALKGAKRNGLAVQDVKRFYELTNEPFFNALVKNGKPTDDTRGYLYKTLAETQSSAGFLFEKNKTITSTSEYPDTAFGKQLKNVATFIRSGLPTRIYYTSLGGFDTHVNQIPQHARLLKTYSEAVAALMNDLQKAGMADDVLVLTFSEFGRRVAPNASQGTDHGAANTLFLLGKGLKEKGILNAAPDLAALEDGDIKHTIDFREVYATVLQNWMEVDAAAILGKKYALKTWL
ncbi:MAG: DUF1501 domain-containing protein, partial [Bacteroidia bacterium]